MLPRSNQALRDCLARALKHNDMKEFAGIISRSKHPRKLSLAFEEQPLEQKLINIASSLIQLQQVRHEADYKGRRELVQRFPKLWALYDYHDQTPNEELFLHYLLAR